MTHKVQPALASRLVAAQAELAKILADKACHPITYNHYYTTTIQKMRSKGQLAKMEVIMKKNEKTTYDYQRNSSTSIDPRGLAAGLANMSVEEDMDKFSASDALMCALAYYKVSSPIQSCLAWSTNCFQDELKYFVNCVTKQVIERRLLKDLDKELLSPIDFEDMTDEQLGALAAEPANIMQNRERLQKIKATLEEGQRAFKHALGGF